MRAFSYYEAAGHFNLPGLVLADIFHAAVDRPRPTYHDVLTLPSSVHHHVVRPTRSLWAS